MKPNNHAILLGIIAAIGASEAWAGVARIDAVGRGNSVNVQRAGATLHLRKDDELLAGDQVSTDAQTAVDLHLDDDTLIRVGVNSSYMVEENTKLHTLMHRLLKGAVRVLVKKIYDEKDGGTAKVPADGVKFRLYTPEGTVGVRGTEFVVARVGDTTELSGISGEVMFGPAEAEFTNAGKFVKVGRGFRSSVVKSGAPAKPVNYPLDSYLKQLDGKGGAFGPLAMRAKASNLKQRSEDQAAQSRPAVPAPALAKAEPRKSFAGEPPEPRTEKKPDPKDAQKELFLAVQDANEARAEGALAKGADINGTGDLGYTALQLAMLNFAPGNKASTNMIIFLIKHGADVNIKDKNGYTPLMLVAIQHLPFELAPALVDRAASLDATDPNGKTVYDLARENKYPELVKYLEREASADSAAAQENIRAAGKGKKK